MGDKKLAIYQVESGAIELSFDDSYETMWATQKQIAEVFGVTPQNVTIHLKKYFQVVN